MVDHGAAHRKLKTQLKLAGERLRLLQQKKEALAKQQRRNLALLLEQKKIESARIRVEHVIGEEIHVELLEILELYCELLLARAGLLEPREPDPSLLEPIQSVMYAAGKSDVKELVTVRDILFQKYGKEFATTALENRDGHVLKKLTVDPPKPELVERYLEEIAKTYKMIYKDGRVSQMRDDYDDSNGGNVAESEKVSVIPLDTKDDDLKLPSPPSTAPAEKPKANTPIKTDPPVQNKTTASDSTSGGGIPSLDDLAKRFESLKKR